MICIRSQKWTSKQKSFIRLEPCSSNINRYMPVDNQYHLALNKLNTENKSLLTKTRNNLKPPEATWNHLKPPETTCKHLKLPRNYLKLPETIQTLAETNRNHSWINCNSPKPAVLQFFVVAKLISSSVPFV